VLLPTAGVVKSSEVVAPKTAFGFFGSVIAIVVAGTAATSVGLASAGDSGLALAALAGGCLVLVGLLFWIIRTFATNPEKFVVGPITGSEYLRILQWTAGDSSAGEHAEQLMVDTSGTNAALPTGVAKVIDAAPRNEDDVEV